MAAPIALTGLATALQVGPGEVISLVGGGGKTTLLFALGRQLEGAVVLTTTTKMGRHQTDGRLTLTAPSDHELQAALNANHAVLVRKAETASKAIGVSTDDVDRYATIADYVVVEADGSRHHPFKAPRPFEPVIAPSTTLLLACIGADAIDRCIADQCFRPLRVAAIAGCSPYERLTPQRAAAVLLSSRGSQKDRPSTARGVVVVNRVTDAASERVAELCEIVGATMPVVAIAASEADAALHPGRS